MTMHVIAYDTANPGDTSDLKRQIQAFEPARIRRLALLVKTEGNSDLNDFSREYGLVAAEKELTEYGGPELVTRSTFLFSTGCEGAMTPFGYLFVDHDEPDAAPSAHGIALAMGCARSRSLLPDEIGTPTHADITADTVRAAMEQAGVRAEQVELVIVKTPIMSHIPATAPETHNKRITSAYSKAVGALGAGVALGEVDRANIVQEAFNRDHHLHAKRAMVFSGSELDCVEIMLLANRPGAAGNLVIRTGLLDDLLDAAGVRNALRAAGGVIDEEGRLRNPELLAAMMVKAGVAPDGRVRGMRTTIKTSHLDMDKHIRATMSGIVGSILGSCRTFISANTVHQAPVGGGICACIVRTA